MEKKNSKKKSPQNHIEIKEAHCAIDLNPNWPLHVDIKKKSGAVSQTIPGVGHSAIFLHYGPTCTVEEYLGDLLRYFEAYMKIEQDKRITHKGLSGRRIRVSMATIEIESHHRDKEGRIVHYPEPGITPARIFIYVGYKIRGMPVLVGYILPKDAYKTYRAEAEKILNSLEPFVSGKKEKGTAKK